MVRVDEAVIARLKKEGKTFEVLVDCDKAIEFREGKIESLEEVLATREIFSDVKQSERATDIDIKKAFHTDVFNEIAAQIIKKGEVQLTTEHKNKLREEKKKKIVEMIHKNAINPQSDVPHPRERIENAMKEAKVRIDEFKSAEDQMQEVISQLRSLLPLKIETREIEILIPGQYAGSSYGILKRLGKMLKDDWLDNGSLKVVLEIPAGIQEELENEVSKLTKGDFDLKILKKI